MTILVLILALPLGIVQFQDVSDAASYGSEASPLSELVCTITPSSELNATTYPGAHVTITVESGSFPLGEVTVSPIGTGSTGLTVSTDDVVSGNVTCSSRIRMPDEDGNIVRYAYIYVVDVDGEVSISTGDGGGCDLEVDGVVRFRQMTLTGGSLPDGMTVDGYASLSGAPTAPGDYYFTLQGRAELDTGVSSEPYTFHVNVYEPVSTTTLSTDHIYAVEGDTVTFTVYGSTGDATEYQAVVTTTGGRLSADEVTDGDTVSLKCPQVNGTTDIVVTVASDVEGVSSSTASLTVTVVDRLQVSAPTVGTVGSR